MEVQKRTPSSHPTPSHVMCAKEKTLTCVQEQKSVIIPIPCKVCVELLLLLVLSPGATITTAYGTTTTTTTVSTTTCLIKAGRVPLILTNQRTNAPTNQRNQRTNEPTNQRTNEPTNQRTNEPTNQRTNEPRKKTNQPNQRNQRTNGTSGGLLYRIGFVVESSTGVVLCSAEKVSIPTRPYPM